MYYYFCRDYMLKFRSGLFVFCSFYIFRLYLFLFVFVVLVIVDVVIVFFFWFGLNLGKLRWWFYYFKGCWLICCIRLKRSIGVLKVVVILWGILCFCGWLSFLGVVSVGSVWLMLCVKLCLWLSSVLFGYG